MDRWRGKWALITGASAGIGKALAEQLAAGGANLVLTARRKDRLEQLAADLRTRNGVVVATFPADLTQPGSPDALFAYTQGKGIAIELLANNAGFGAYGKFEEMPLRRQLEMVQVNIAAVIHLTHLYAPPMIARRHGDILIVASTAGFQGVPYITTYAATKSFDLFFAEALAEEMRPYGVHVCALCPGATETEFQDVAAQPDYAFRSAETADKVAHVGLAALAKGKSMVISGAKNKLSVQSQRMAPRSLVTGVAARMFRPRAKNA
jgi:short-subunit dehydrogenase